MSCGSCLQGCPTNAGKSTMNTYIHDAWAQGGSSCAPTRGRARRDRGRRGDGRRVRRPRRRVAPVDAGAVVVAAGTLNTPQLLLRSGLPDSPSSRLVGRNLGFHPVRLVYGLFDEPQDAHMVYPITAHAMAHQQDEDGGFVIEATTIRTRSASRPRRGRERPALGRSRSSRRVRKYRHWNGVLAMVNDDNNGRVELDEDGDESFTAAFNEAELGRMDGALDVLAQRAARPRARRAVLWTGLRPRTCRARAGWAAIRSARWSTRTAQS